MFEITLYIILLIDYVQQIARYFRKELSGLGQTHLMYKNS